MARLFFITLMCGISLIIGPFGTSCSAEPISLALSREVMDVDTFFSGGSVTIKGQIPSDDDVALEILGPVVDGLYDVKGRVGGLWMTRYKVHLGNAPSLYMLLLPPGPQWGDKTAGLGLGVDNLKQSLAFGDSEVSTDDVFNMFVQLKRSEKLYGQAADAVSYGPGANGQKHFTATFKFPSSTTVGTYTIRATPIRSGHLGSAVSRDLTVQEIGFVKLVNELASNRRLIYGFSAVLIALLSGGIMGFIFKGGGSH
ncbi:MAG: TIGR02186 family protein [Desulfobacterales bacterium]|nr:TIGR02186 family protein [Desulfobacterales bacterium]